MINEKKETPLIVLLGGGATGFYTAEALIEAGFSVVMINQDKALGGGTRHFIRYDKVKMKLGLLKVFLNILKSPQFLGYYGGVNVGFKGDIELKELISLNPAVIVLATGSQGRKTLDIEGMNLEGVYNAYENAQIYNRAPGFEKKFPKIGEKVAILGVGNVTADMIFWLGNEKKDLVKSINVLARRGPFEFKMTRKEVKEILPFIDPKGLMVEIERVLNIFYLSRSLPYFSDTLMDEKSGKKIENPFHLLGEKEKDTETLLKRMQLNSDEIAQIKSKAKEKTPNETNVKVFFHFLTEPEKLEEDPNNPGKLKKIFLTHNILYFEKKSGQVRSKKLTTQNHLSQIEADTFIFSIGSIIDAEIGLQTEGGRLVNDPNIPYRIIHEDPEIDKKKMLWAFGWARRPSVGLVGNTKEDVRTGIHLLIEHLKKSSFTNPMKQADLESLLQSHQVKWVTKEQILPIHESEIDSKSLFSSSHISASLTQQA